MSALLPLPDAANRVSTTNFIRPHTHPQTHTDCVFGLAQTHKPGHTLPHGFSNYGRPVRNSVSRFRLSPTTVAPRPTPLRSGGAPFRLLLLHSLACFPQSGRGGFRRTFQRGRLRSQATQPKPYFQSSAKIFPAPRDGVYCPAQQAPYTGKPD